MKKQRKKKILDVIMVLIIMIIMVSGVMAAKSFKESTATKEASNVVVEKETEIIEDVVEENVVDDLEEQKTETQEPEKQESEKQEPVQQESEKKEPEKKEPVQQEPESQEYSCTIKISCETILNNMENLREGKESYVPSSGVILSTTTVNFKEGETVFDVLKRVCSSKGIQLEYSWTPMYDSYYIEGINHLYEFDCGGQSGWMYKVNGWFPNYGCSSYVLEDGDTIVWCYTCNGLGADVGGRVNH